MTIRTTLIASSLIAASLVTGSAHAVMQGRDLNGSIGSFEAYYDTDLNITWLADANYAKTSGVDADGQMTWAVANTWAANLSFTDGTNVYDDWRLPTTLQPDASCYNQSGGTSFGYSCTGSEMGHLFYVELGGTAGQSILTSTDPDLAKFTNIQSSYYSATEYAFNNNFVWAYGFHNGEQSTGFKGGAYAFAVSSGDVGITAVVPEADTWTMLLAGLGLVGVAVRRRRG